LFWCILVHFGRSVRAFKLRTTAELYLCRRQ